MQVNSRANCAFTAIAEMNKIVWVRPADVIYKVTCNRTLRCGDILDGDWDLLRRRLDRTAKHSAIEQHFSHGVEWDDTELFKSIYARRLARGESPNGAKSLADLKIFYQRYDRLFESLRREGFLVGVDDNGVSVKLPHVHVGRDGEIFFGKDGNHRLAMAKILGMEAIPCRVYARHALWQEIRDLAMAKGPEACRTKSRLWPHPDLADLGQPRLGAPQTPPRGYFKNLTEAIRKRGEKLRKIGARTRRRDGQNRNIET